MLYHFPLKFTSLYNVVVAFNRNLFNLLMNITTHIFFIVLVSYSAYAPVGIYSFHDLYAVALASIRSIRNVVPINKVSLEYYKTNIKG